MRHTQRRAAAGGRGRGGSGASRVSRLAGVAPRAGAPRPRPPGAAGSKKNAMSRHAPVTMALRSQGAPFIRKKVNEGAHTVRTVIRTATAHRNYGFICYPSFYHLPHTHTTTPQ